MAHMPSSNDRDIFSNPSAGFFKAGTKISSNIVWHNCFVSSKFPLHMLNLWTNHPHCFSTYCSIHLNQIQSPWTCREHDLPKHRGKRPTRRKKPEDCRHWRNTLRVQLETKEWEVLYKFGVYKSIILFIETLIPLVVLTPFCSMLSARSHNVNTQTVSVHLAVRMFATTQRGFQINMFFWGEMGYS